MSEHRIKCKTEYFIIIIIIIIWNGKNINLVPPGDVLVVTSCRPTILYIPFSGKLIDSSWRPRWKGTLPSFIHVKFYPVSARHLILETKKKNMCQISQGNSRNTYHYILIYTTTIMCLCKVFKRHINAVGLYWSQIN